MTEMTYTRLGASGLVVSRLCLGTMTFNLGSEWLTGITKVGQDAATEIVDTSLDAGINFFDSADGYSAGESERALGVALGNRRKDVVVCTKMGFRQSEAMIDAGLSRGHITRSIEASLSRLGTDYIDLLVLHKTDFTTPMEETTRALDDAVRAGKIRYLGVSNWPAWQTARAVEFQRQNGLAPFIAGQMYYNAVARDLEQDILPMMGKMGLGLMAWSPLAGGLLTGKYDPHNLAAGEGRLTEFNFLGTEPNQAADALRAMKAIAEREGASLAQVAYAWILCKNKSHTVIVGPSRRAHLDDAVAAVGLTLSEEDIVSIDAAAPAARRYPEWFDQMMTDETFTKALG